MARGWPPVSQVLERSGEGEEGVCGRLLLLEGGTASGSERAAVGRDGRDPVRRRNEARWGWHNNRCRSCIRAFKGDVVAAVWRRGNGRNDVCNRLNRRTRSCVTCLLHSRQARDEGGSAGCSEERMTRPPFSVDSCNFVNRSAIVWQSTICSRIISLTVERRNSSYPCAGPTPRTNSVLCL